MSGPTDRPPLRGSADLGSLTVINEVSEAEEQEPLAMHAAGRDTDEPAFETVLSKTDHRRSSSTEIVEDEKERPTLLPPADLKRLEKKHKKALQRANQQKSSEDEEKESRARKRSRVPAATLKTLLATVYYTGTTFAAIAAFVLLFIGVCYKAKAALVAGTFLAFSAFGMCTNHCFTQGVGIAKRPTEREREVAMEEQRILASVAERSLSMAPPDEKSQQEAVQQQEAGASEVTKAAVASAVDRLLTRRLSTLGGMSVMYPDPATRAMMRQHSRGRRSSMMHLARSMSIAPHEPWIHQVGIDEYAEFA